MSERLVGKHGPKIQPHLQPGERLLDVVAGIALTVALRGKADPTLRVGGRLASQLQGIDKRANGILCITDQRVLFLRVGFTSIKELRGQVRRDQVGSLRRVEGVAFTYAVCLTDGSDAPFTGNSHDYVAVAAALDLVIDPMTGQALPQDGSAREEDR